MSTTSRCHICMLACSIFDPSQKDGWNQIWIDMYNITKFLEHNNSRVYYDSATKNTMPKRLF